MWFCRAGKQSEYYDYYMSCQKIFFPSTEYNVNLKNLEWIEYRDVVSQEIHTYNRTTISNLACQLKYFVEDMKKDDYVLIPQGSKNGEHLYTLAVITGGYNYNKDAKLHHSHSIRVVLTDISKNVFPQEIQYSLGTYRTIFHLKKEEKIKSILNKNFKIEL